MPFRDIAMTPYSKHLKEKQRKELSELQGEDPTEESEQFEARLLCSTDVCPFPNLRTKQGYFSFCHQILTLGFQGLWCWDVLGLLGIRF